MDIRIGNDVKVVISSKEFGDIDTTNIKKMTCSFVRTHSCDCCEEESQCLTFHHSSPYTIHSCGNLLYNVNPANCYHTPYSDSHDCGFVVCDQPDLFVSRCKLNEDGNIIAYFPAEAQKLIGYYKCVFQIKVYEKGWDFDNLHSYSIEYKDAFNLVTKGGSVGSITIKPTVDVRFDTYISTLTEPQLQAYKDNYLQLILKSDGFKLNTLTSGIREVKIAGANKRIIVISTYDSLQLVFNSFVFPTTMYKLNDTYYMYVSDYTYSSNTIDLQLTVSGISNPITPGLPDFNVDPEIPDESENPDTPDQTNRVIIYSYDKKTIYVYGNITNNKLTIYEQ